MISGRFCSIRGTGESHRDRFKNNFWLPDRSARLSMHHILHGFMI